jgi:hypothetical protein
MMTVQDALQSILSRPTPQGLRALQGALLASVRDGEALEQALALSGQFHAYLCELESKITARDYSELASRLDIGAVGAVALENVVAGQGHEIWQRLLLGGLGESLMVAASRQYIRAWETETGLVHTCAAWHLTQALWHTSCRLQPDHPSTERWEAIQALLAPAHDPAVPGPAKALLLGRIFQLLLATSVASLSWPSPEEPA